MFRGAGQIEVRRGTREASSSLGQAIEALTRGEIVCVFPEGTITGEPDLQPMRGKTGTARLTLASGAPLIPCALWGSANFFPLGHRPRLRPRQKIVVRIGRPMDVVESDDRAGWRELTDRLMGEIAALSAELRPQVPDRRGKKLKRTPKKAPGT